MIPMTHADTNLVREWDEVRTAFATSILVDTALSSLAQNLDGLEWPDGQAGETAAEYIDLDYADLQRELALRGHADAAPLLVQILRETLAFDQPFGEMVQQTQAAADRENALLRSITRLGIPENFPLELALLDTTARDLCRTEQVWTIVEFAVFAQRLAQGVIVGGEFQRLLNALTQLDEHTLATLLPVRVGTTGVHLAEALGQATRAPDPASHAARALSWFDAELAQWTKQPDVRATIRRELTVLRNEARERQAAELVFAQLKLRRSLGGGFRSVLKHWFKF